MWNRAELKSGAKLALRGTYWQAFLVSLLAAIVVNLFLSVDLIMTWHLLNSRALIQTDPMEYVSGLEIERTVNFLIGPYGIFVGLPILVGLARFFVRNRSGEGDADDLFSAFFSHYGGRVWAMFVTRLFVLLWGLLLIVPGVIAALEYCMVKYLLAENPELPGSRARAISSTLTEGQKGNILVLILSFVGWYALGLVCAGVGILFVNPYFDASMAELYVFLRDRAIQSGRLNPAELGLQPAAPAPGPVVY
jgi:hypothetical protein